MTERQERKTESQRWKRMNAEFFPSGPPRFALYNTSRAVEGERGKISIALRWEGGKDVESSVAVIPRGGKNEGY